MSFSSRPISDLDLLYGQIEIEDKDKDELLIPSPTPICPHDHL